MYTVKSIVEKAGLVSAFFVSDMYEWLIESGLELHECELDIVGDEGLIVTLRREYDGDYEYTDYWISLGIDNHTITFETDDVYSYYFKNLEELKEIFNK